MKKYFNTLGLVGLLSVFIVMAFAACGGDDDVKVAEQLAATTVTTTKVAEQPVATAVTTTEANAIVEKLTLKASTPIVADWVRHIGGERVEVESLVPAGVNPHGFQPGSKTLAETTKADAVFLVGLAYEGLWMTKLMENNDGIPFTVLGDVIEVIHDEHDDHDEHDEHDDHDEHDEDEDHDDHDEHDEDEKHDDHDEDEDHDDHDEHDEDEKHDDHDEDEDHDDHDEHDEDEKHDDHDEDEDHDDHDEHDEDEKHDDHDEDEDHDDHDEHDEDEKHDDHDEHEGHDHSQGNPHYWFDPIRVAQVVDVIAGTLTEIDPGSADVYTKNANEYKAMLMALDKEIAEKINSIPEADRKVMTEHESMIYFTERYGLQSIKSVIPKTSSETGPTPKDLKRAIEAVERHDLKVIFVEAETNKAAAERVAEETGLKLSEELQVETLNEGQSYEEFMRRNVNIIVSSLVE